MKILNLTQGTPEWLAARTRYNTASEAPAMMGVSKYMSRQELIRQKATGIVPDVSPEKQRLFDRGHEAEAAARATLERMIGEDLYPTTATDDDGYLLASFDGITMDERIGFEHKLWSESLAVQVRAGELEPHYYWQLEQQILVGGLEKVIFVCSDGTEERFVSMEYIPVPGRAETLLAGWRQFDEDVKNYQHVEEAPKLVGSAPEMLPALRLQVTGAVTFSNLPEFKQHAMAVIGDIKTDLQTDQDFADAEKTVKWLKDVEDKLAAAKASALAQTESIDALFSAIDEIASHAASTRLNLDKQVKREKENRKLEIVTKAQQALNAYVDEINVRLNGYLPAQTGNFGEVIKGLKSIDSMRDKVSAELARCKVEASEQAARIDANLRMLDDDTKRGLFPDLKTVCTKAADDFAALLTSRLAERDRIRQEEEARAAAKANAQSDQAPAVLSGPVAPTLGEVLRAVAPPVIAQDIAPSAVGATIKLGEINARLGLTVTADFLTSLGFVATTERNAKLYRAADFPGICQALINHIAAVATTTYKDAA